MWLASMPAARPLLLGGIFLLNVVHPLIHGTVLDGGMLDQVLANADMLAAPIAQG